MMALVDGKYKAIDESRELPGLTIAMMEAVLAWRFETGATRLIREFRDGLQN